MEPGRTNDEDRMNFIEFWANYIKTHSDKEWSRQQNVLIDSRILSSRGFYRELAKTEEGREKINLLIKDLIIHKI